MPAQVNWNPSRKELRNFGLVLLIGFGVIGFLTYRSGRHGLAEGLWIGSAAVALLSCAAPVLARPFYVIWMSVGAAIGFVMSRVVMTIIFFVVITPVAIVFRLKGRDALGLRKSSGVGYWSPHPATKDRSDYEHLF